MFILGVVVGVLAFNAWVIYRRNYHPENPDGPEFSLMRTTIVGLATGVAFLSAHFCYLFVGHELLPSRVPDAPEVPFDVVVIGAIGIIWHSVYVCWEQLKGTRLKKLRSDLQALDTTSVEETTLDILHRQIALAAKRDEITMEQAERRANLLYSLGLLFLVGAIAGPIGAAWLYQAVDPLSDTTVTELKELKHALGELPSQTTLHVERDWHILLGGVTFGFFLLAAATGLLRQQAKEVRIYFRVGERVNYFARLESVVRIKAALALQSESEERALVDLVVQRLLRANWADEEEVGESETDTPRKLLDDVAKNAMT